jgi:adenylylsulfate reductase subunit A
MAPSQTLKWVESGKLPGDQDVEIEGTEPYIVGGHTASGYWVNTQRETTIAGLYAAGDVAGGCPQKYVTGALAEGEIAALDMIEKMEKDFTYPNLEEQAGEILKAYGQFLENQSPMFTVDELEEAMQKVMDEYAGGIATHYQYNEKQLNLAREKITHIQELAAQAGAGDMHELMFIYELKERLEICQTLIDHMKNRKETRWHSFNENLDHPESKEEYFKYVNSKMEQGVRKIFLRDIVKEENYEHQN